MLLTTQFKADAMACGEKMVPKGLAVTGKKRLSNKFEISSEKQEPIKSISCGEFQIGFGWIGKSDINSCFF